MAAFRPLTRSLITFGANSRVLPTSTLTSRGTYLFNSSDSQIRMSSTQENRAGATYSTTDTGDKPADPYKEVNSDADASIKEKVEDLIAFVEGVKFGMMTTRQSQSGLLVSRCMSLVARVRFINPLRFRYAEINGDIRRTELTFCSIRTQKRGRLMNCILTPMLIWDS